MLINSKVESTINEDPRLAENAVLRHSITKYREIVDPAHSFQFFVKSIFKQTIRVVILSGNTWACNCSTPLGACDVCNHIIRAFIYHQNRKGFPVEVGFSHPEVKIEPPTILLHNFTRRIKVS